jgi:hypothetical protein
MSLKDSLNSSPCVSKRICLGVQHALKYRNQHRGFVIKEVIQAPDLNAGRRGDIPNIDDFKSSLLEQALGGVQHIRDPLHATPLSGLPVQCAK